MPLENAGKMLGKLALRWPVNWSKAATEVAVSRAARNSQASHGFGFVSQLVQNVFESTSAEYGQAARFNQLTNQDGCGAERPQLHQHHLSHEKIALSHPIILVGK